VNATLLTAGERTYGVVQDGTDLERLTNLGDTAARMCSAQTRKLGEDANVFFDSQGGVHGQRLRREANAASCSRDNRPIDGDRATVWASSADDDL
jgi:hypothetical protein